MTKLYIIAILVLTICFEETNCQSNAIKNGAYRNSVDFNKNKPLYETDFIFIKKNSKKIPELYRVKSKNKKIKKSLIKYSVWGIYNDSTFYLNLKRIGMVNGYIKITKFGKYSYFKGLPIKTLAQEAGLNNAAFTYGLTGAFVTGTMIASENENKIHYVLNMETGMINLLTRDYMIKILQPYYELLFNFQHEPNNDSLEILLKYIDLVNKTVE